MRVFAIAFMGILFLSAAFAADPAPLGKALSKVYPLLKPDEQTVVLVTFKDKGDVSKFRSSAAEQFITPRAVARRLKVRTPDQVIDNLDYPLEPTYVAAVAQRVVQVRHELKWFNGVSVVATKAQIAELRGLPFVREIELVNRWKKRAGDEQATVTKEAPRTSTPRATTSLDYGTSLGQVSLINVPAVHNLGIYGQGVVIGMFDNGWRNPGHQAFDSMHIIATHDFVDHKVSVIPNDPDPGFGSHGIWTLSTIGGYFPGQLIGPAFKASFILARTENDSSETPIEEDNWAAGIQWADSIGVDVSSTSLGYFTFDPPYTSLTWQDMNGETALITNAADRAVALGIVVVNSAGNSGPGDSTHNTLIAPADGDSVITAGAVNSSGDRASFSSIGPTTSIPPRIKPDIMADGVFVKAASSTDTVNYVNVSGTSFSCPLSAGVAALILCAHPSLTPIQVREAMRQTANNEGSPNNFYGWGVLDALAAVNYYGLVSFAHIGGTAYLDLNGDGNREPGEPALAGISIHLAGAAAESTMTDSAGGFSFDSLAVGTYFLTQQFPAGWIQTQPAGAVDTVVIDSAMQNVTGRNFGRFQLGSISGVAFDDTNHNGIRDSGEAGLAHWVILLNGGSFGRTTTDSAGNFTFANLRYGTYVVTDSALAGWVQTVPTANGSDTVKIRSGLDTAGLVFGHVYAPTANYSVFTGWNLLSLPQAVSDHSKSALYPTASSAAFAYNFGYNVIDTIPNGIGYWLKFDTPQNVVLQGTSRTRDTVTLRPGWNMIGTLSSPAPVASIVQSPDSVVISQYFSYNNGGYVPHLIDTLLPHYGYWVKARSAGTLVLSSASIGPRATLRSPILRLPDGLSTLTVSDRSGRHQRLYFGADEALRRELGLFELPPLPPEGAFDARFASQRYVEYSGSPAATIPIRIVSASYPLTIAWERGTSMETVGLQINSHRIPLIGNGEVQVAEPKSELSLITGQGAEATVPKEYSLEQNFPNPFNPTTVIRYSLPERQHVDLKIFDVFGQEVATLVDDTKEAGVYNVRWDASGKASGIYFYRLRARDYNLTRKLMLVK